MSVLRLFTLGIGFLALASCQTAQGLKEDLRAIDVSSWGTGKTASSENLMAGDCPTVEIVQELGYLSEFTNNADPSLNSMISSIDMNRIESTCSYKTGSVAVDLQVGFQGKLGPKGQASGETFFSYPFFVAVLSPNNQIMAKEVFAASLTYDRGATEQVYVESLRHVIPVKSKSDGTRHKIVLGFQLGPDQLAYNRAILEAPAP